jgi:signal transduction histidine kinase/HAMP domain-containing protein
MAIIISLFLENSPIPIWPASLLGWVGWFLMLGLVVWLVWLWRGYNAVLNRRYWITFGILAAFIPISSLFFGARIHGVSLPLPGLPQEQPGPAMMFFSAVPWVLAGGMLGPLAGAVLGALAGLFGFLWDSHSIFTPLELALLGAVFGTLVRQRYRTTIFLLLRQPIVAVLVLAFMYIPLYVVGAFFATTGIVAVRLDYAISSAWPAFLAMSGELFIAGIIAQILTILFPEQFQRNTPLQPSPAEKSLQIRFLFVAGFLIVLLLTAVLVVNWLGAGRAARQMINDRMQGIAQIAADGVPFFLETGQNLAIQIADDPEFILSTPEELNTLLAARVLAIPYFDQLMVLDVNGQLVSSYPDDGTSEFVLTPQELAGVDLARNGVRIQIYTIPSKVQGEPARVSFMVAAKDETGQVARILVARSDLTINPLSQPIINSLESAKELGGAGMLIDENGLIVFPTMVMTPYVGEQSDEPSFYDQTAPDGTREMVYYLPVEGRSLAVMITVPAQTAQQLALSIAAPLSLMTLLLGLAAVIALYFGLDVITVSLKNLASEAVHIAEGHLDRSLSVVGVDEVGQLRGSFEQMRASLQLRLEELNSLLVVSQGVASSLEMKDAVQSVLEAVEATGASAARVAIKHAGTFGNADVSLTSYGIGPASSKYEYLDAQVIVLAQKREILLIPNVNRARGIGLDPSLPQPVSLLGIALRHENQFYGVLWAAYDQQRNFNNPEVRYFTTLAGHAALAAANAHLFMTAEVGRQRLAAILASTPDPVLVTDPENRLLLANPAAWQVLGASVGKGEGKAIDAVITQRSLLSILPMSSPDKLSVEVELPTGQTYLATASPVVAEGKLVGRVCILRDVTHFKELDSMKSEFVSTVSHDLRSPLTLMRGYATMLELVGNLNDQQQSYVTKIIMGVENMTRLVNNLLDLGRIEAGVGLQLERIPLAEILDRVTGTLQASATEKEVQLFVDISSGESPTIEADPALLHQAVYNLVENAIKYTPSGGKIFVRVKPQVDFAVIEVQDSGIGITPIDMPRLFEKFYRSAQREARQQKGSGLGLAIVRSIAERHGGKVWVESQLGEGSTFFLQIPWVQIRS